MCADCTLRRDHLNFSDPHLVPGCEIRQAWGGENTQTWTFRIKLWRHMGRRPFFIGGNRRLKVSDTSFLKIFNGPRATFLIQSPRGLNFNLVGPFLVRLHYITRVATSWFVYFIKVCFLWQKYLFTATSVARLTAPPGRHRDTSWSLFNLMPKLASHGHGATLQRRLINFKDFNFKHSTGKCLHWY